MSDLIRYSVVVILIILLLLDISLLKTTGEQIREQTRREGRVPRRILVLLNMLSLMGIGLVVMMIMVLSGWR
ncbi:TPA: hypothetical protein I8Y21_006448 [Klebsiella oxytoca]|uniref:Uncharacterized protein n=1 Tax=Klebsiella oxytoca TaxID=571 RepID=A0AAN5LFB7_KLEOX|nr:hypothetical protein [Klebsiella oxytoca]HAT1685567.1 hypothetical protein [Klebsiella oxytoca]